MVSDSYNGTAATSATMAEDLDGETPPSKPYAVEEVALVVPETDDPKLPVMTFRAWFLGLASCTLLIFLNTFFAFRTQPLDISAVLIQITVLPIGKFMAATLPDKRYMAFGRWSFTLNPGPFNIKEHVIVTIMANGGVTGSGGDSHPMGIITIMKSYYKLHLNFLCAFLIVSTTQILGYGWAGLLRKFLVEPSDMWWPSNVAQVSLLRALHEKEPNTKRMTRMKFFLLFMATSFIYYIFPGYIFPILTFFSWVCWVWPRSITAQQIGSGYHGLGVGAFTLDWAGISAYHGSPLISPFATILNIGFGFLLFVYIIIPLFYWKFNAFDAQKFPIFSNQMFTSSGQTYDIDKILTPNYELNVAAYENYSKLYLSPLFALSIASGFWRLTATLSHVALFHGSVIWKQSISAMKNNIKLDIHAKLMKSYKQVPAWCYLLLLIGSIPLPILMSFVWKDQVQLPWWGMLLAFSMSSIVTLPIGIIQATTNQQPGYDVVAQFIIGFLLPGKPIANILFKIYGHTTVMHALSFLADLKLGHYMKIPPRSMFTAQLVGTIVSCTVNFIVGWWMLESVQNICDVKALHPESPWTCPKFLFEFDTSVIWGLIGPQKLFGAEGMYRNLIWLFIVGALLPVPVWILSKIYPEKKWIPLINIPIISYGFAGMPPATPTNKACWIITGTIFNYVVFKYRKRWWQRYNYVLSAALDAGTAFMGVLLFFALQNEGVIFKWWGSEPDHCPLASCPTAPGIEVHGCPVFS